ncbi:MAG TPA: AAA family ATPase, partial [Leptospiraceae bacterium]|nr:AAA family ATPase [Leptospiraceae bacterium]
MNELQPLENREEKSDTGFEFDLTPSQIVTELDQHIIGQKNAKKAVAIALRNRTRRRKLEPSIREEIYPKNILMIGPTGVGKTEIARRLAKLCRAPFLKVEATKYTEVGYVGRDVESMIRDLMSVSLNLVKAEFRKKVEEDARKKAEDLVLDILIPPPPAPSGAGFQTDFISAEEEERKKSYQSTREIFRSRLRNGKFDSQEIEIELSSPNPGNMPSMQVFGAGNLEEMDS